VVKSTEGSFSGISEAEGITACPRFSKKLKNFCRISFDVIVYYLYQILENYKALSSVILANAGIQVNSEFSDWIPVFTGMTNGIELGSPGVPEDDKKYSLLII
jgi:hypothetical protein